MPRWQTLPAIPVRDSRTAMIDSAPPTLAALVPRFLQWFKFVREMSVHTVAAYGSDLQAFVHFCDLGGITDPRDVSAAHVELFLAWLRQERKLAATSANRHLHAVRTFFRYLVRERLVASNPTADAYGLKATRRLPTYLTIPEQESVLEHLIRDHTPQGQRDLALVATLLFAGLRVSEVVNLTLADVDIDASTIRVRHGKGDKDRELPIIPRLRGILRAYLSDGRGRLPDAGAPWFFLANTREGQRARHRRLAPLLTRSVHAFVRLKIAPLVGKRVHPHTLRHSFASRLRENGADLQLIQEALGHASITTTTIYAHLSTSKRRQEITRLLSEEA